MARSFENMAILSSITHNFPLDVPVFAFPFAQISAVNQSQFIIEAREALNRFNQQHDSQVQSLPLSQLFVVTSKAETSLGSVSWSLIPLYSQR